MSKFVLFFFGLKYLLLLILILIHFILKRKSSRLRFLKVNVIGIRGTSGVYLETNAKKNTLARNIRDVM